MVWTEDSVYGLTCCLEASVLVEMNFAHLAESERPGDGELPFRHIFDVLRTMWSLS